MLWIGDHSKTIPPKYHCSNMLFQNKCRSFHHFKDISIYRNDGHIELRAGLSYIHNNNPGKTKQKNHHKYFDNL